MASETLTIGGDLTVRRVGYGAMALTGPGGWGEPSSSDRARAVLTAAVGAGVQLLDTADSYGPEVSERLLADALHPYPDDVVLATKGGFVRDGPWQLRANGRPEYLRAACEGSLRRLRLDRIDLYYLHTVDGAVPLEESLGALKELRDEGKVRHLGLSNVTVEQIEAARRIVPIASVQNRYSLAARGVEDDIVDLCEREKLAYLPWQPLARGALARNNGALHEVAVKHGATPATVALAWLLARSPAIVVIPGTLSVEHLQQNVNALSLELDAHDRAKLDGFRPPRFDARRVASSFLPTPLRRFVGSILRAQGRR